MDGKKQKKNFAEAVLGEVKPIDHDLVELERLYDVAFDDSARAYPEFKKQLLPPTAAFLERICSTG